MLGSMRKYSTLRRTTYHDLEEENSENLGSQRLSTGCFLPETQLHKKGAGLSRENRSLASSTKNCN